MWRRRLWRMRRLRRLDLAPAPLRVMLRTKNLDSSFTTAKRFNNQFRMRSATIPNHAEGFVDSSISVCCSCLAVVLIHELINASDRRLIA